MNGKGRREGQGGNMAVTMILAILAVLGGLVGGCIMVVYYRRSDRRQETALLVLFIQEFVLLYKRCAMYYQQMITGKVSFSSLCETTDTGTLEKLAGVSSNPKVLSTLVQVKSNFFQVIKWANRVNEYSVLTRVNQPQDADNLQEAKRSRPAWKSREEALMTDAQSKAMAFFMGDVTAPDGSFGRSRFIEYKADIIEIISHLRLLDKAGSLKTFIEKCRRELDEDSDKIEESRKKEEDYWIGQGKNFLPRDTFISDLSKKPKHI